MAIILRGPFFAHAKKRHLSINAVFNEKTGSETSLRLLNLSFFETKPT
jgi:hypothetical protein